MGWAMVNAACCALNVGLYVWLDDPWNLAAAVFSGLVTIIMVAMDA